jgi:hypothetical protein
MNDKIEFSDFRLFWCQAVIFTPDEEISVAKLLKLLSSKWSDKFDTDPLIISVNEPVPREIPKISLKNTANTWHCSMASASFNIIWQKNNQEEESISLLSFFEEAIGFIDEYKKLTGTRVGRVGAKIHYIVQNDNPGLFLASHFCREHWLKQPFNRPKSFELSSHKVYKFDDELYVNSWVRNIAREIVIKGEKLPVILVEQDINTLAEIINDMDFSQERIKTFFSSV